MVSVLRRHASNEHWRHRKTKIVTTIVLMLTALIIVHQSVSVEDEDLAIAQGEVKKEPIREMLSQKKHWQFQMSENGDGVDCHIYTEPIDIASDEAPSPVSSSTTTIPMPEDTRGRNKDQYMIHIHGLHHTGTGYLRETLHDALNKAFSNDHDNAINPSPVASMQDGMRPYQHLLDEARQDKTKTYELLKQYHVPENEGQHLQSIYPRFTDRYHELSRSKSLQKNAHKLAYLADLCVVNKNNTANHTLDNDDSNHFNNKQIGNILLQQWSRYWDTAATFLLQKTPSLDVLFLEKTKVLPTLHVIIIRHPMASNSYGHPLMGMMWVNTWTHIFELLQTDKIEWYAVVTYEALVLYHDQVVEELLEVVRSGMSRHIHQSRGRKLNENPGNKIVDIGGKGTRQSTDLLHRRLHYHDNPSRSPKSPSSYLVPKVKSVELWRKCMTKPRCHDALNRLTKDILPYFGFRNTNERPLSLSPRIVTVSKEFGRVLFSSEGTALNKFRQSRGNLAVDNLIDYKPPIEMISRMKGIHIQR